MNDDDMFNAPMDDGSDKPNGYVSPDGTLEVRDSVDRDGKPFHGYHETELGQHDRWLRQAPDLFEKYQTLLSRLADNLPRREPEHEESLLRAPADRAETVADPRAGVSAGSETVAETESYPTAWAYKQACKAITKWRAKAEFLEARLKQYENPLVTEGKFLSECINRPKDALEGAYRELESIAAQREPETPSLPSSQGEKELEPQWTCLACRVTNYTEDNPLSCWNCRTPITRLAEAVVALDIAVGALIFTRTTDNVDAYLQKREALIAVLRSPGETTQEITKDLSRSDHPSGISDSDQRGDHQANPILREALEACRAYIYRYERRESLRACWGEMRGVVERAKGIK